MLFQNTFSQLYRVLCWVFAEVRVIDSFDHAVRDFVSFEAAILVHDAQVVEDCVVDQAPSVHVFLVVVLARYDVACQSVDGQVVLLYVECRCLYCCLEEGSDWSELLADYEVSSVLL